MSRSIVPLALAVIFLGCKSRSAEPQIKEDDSSAIQLAAAGKLDAKQSASYQSSLTALFDTQLINRNFNGGILVAKEGNILYEKYAGFTNPRKTDVPVTDSTSFHLASTSKPFTGVAVLQLIEKGKIGLNDDIVRYFPGFPYPNVTVKDLLSHRSGLPNYLYFMEDKEKWPADKMVSNADVLDFLIQYQPSQNFRTGSRFNYCNTNYVLLALLVEKVTGIPFPQYLKKNIFDPLGMKHTFVYTPTDSGRVIMSYRPSGDLWANDKFDNTYGDKNVYSTPRDMFKWDAGLYNNHFIRQTLLDSAFQPLSHEKPSIHNYGLGWRMLNLPNGKNIIYHNGKWHGFTPAFARLIDEKAVVIILGNQYNMNMYHAAKFAYNVFGNYIQNGPDAEEESAPVAAPAPLPVKLKPVIKENKKPATKIKTVAIKPEPVKNVKKEKVVAAKTATTAKAIKKTRHTPVAGKTTQKPATSNKKSIIKAKEKKK